MKSKADFLKKVDLKVYEDEDGTAYVEFHHFVERLTKVYLEKVKRCKITEDRAHNLLDKEKENLALIRRGAFSEAVCSVALLRTVLRQWKEKVENGERKEEDEEEQDAVIEVMEEERRM